MTNCEKLQRKLFVKQQLIFLSPEELVSAYQISPQEVRTNFLLDIKELMDREQGFFYMNSQIPKRMFTFFGMIRFDDDISHKEIINSIIFHYNRASESAVKNKIGEEYILEEALLFGLNNYKTCTFEELSHYIYASPIIFNAMLDRKILNYSANYEFCAIVRYLLSSQREVFEEQPYLVKDCLKIVGEVKRPFMETQKLKTKIKKLLSKNR